MTSVAMGAAVFVFNRAVENAMRIALAAATAVALLSAPAVAAPYADVGDFGSFTIPVLVDIPAGPGAGSTFTILSVIINNVGGSEEFGSVNPFMSSLSAGFAFTASVGGANAGQTISSDYDRTGIPDPASDPGGTQTGTLDFMLGNTAFSEVTPGPTIGVLIQGLLTAGDGAGFYDDNEPGSWTFSATGSNMGGVGSGSITISVPPDPRVVVSEPGLLALAGAGLLGLAVVRRRV